MNRQRVRVSAAIATAALFGTSLGHAESRAHERRESRNVILQWNHVALEAVRRSKLGPPIVARALAIVHTCMYDAWAAYDRTANGTRLDGALRRPRREWTIARKREAVSMAAHRALVDLFPAERPLFDGRLRDLGYDPDAGPADLGTPAGIALTACDAVLEFRYQDGSNQLGDENNGAPYSDYTGYTPLNSVDLVTDPNRWQPIRFSSGQAPGFLAPHWGLVEPFTPVDRDALRPPPPAQHPDPGYREQAESLVHISAELTDRQKMIAEYWSDGPSSELPPGHWNLLAQVVSERRGHGLDEDVRLFFALNNALFDAGIAAWDCKRAYDYVRPITALRFLFAGEHITAWGGPFRGTQTIDGKDWMPYQPDTFLTPPFAEYVSGHSTFSAAAAEVLKRFTGSDLFWHGVVLAPGSSRIEPGATPARAVVLFWPTFSSAADQAGMSRRFGGIHFEAGDLEGRRLGRRVGRAVWTKAERLFDGKKTDRQDHER